MILEGWKRDAEKLASYLPTDTPIAKRIGRLLNDVLPQGVEVNPEMFNGSAATLPLSPDLFYVADRQQLGRTRSNLGHAALTYRGAAFVASKEGLPTVLALPAYDGAQLFGNASIFLHELEHLTEREEGFGTASAGVREQRAYKTNEAILSSLDGSDFQAYIDNWPVDFTHTSAAITPQLINNSASLSFLDTVCPEPPKETFAHDMWQEDGISRQMLQSVGRAAVFEKLTVGLDEGLVNKLADNIHSQV